MANVNKNVDFRMTSKGCCKCFLVAISITVVMVIYLEGTQNVSFTTYIMPSLNTRSSFSITNRTQANSKRDVQFLVQKGNVMEHDIRQGKNYLREKQNSANRAQNNSNRALSGFGLNISLNSRQQISKTHGVERGNLTKVIKGDNHNSLQELKVHFAGDAGEASYFSSTESISRDITPTRQGISMTNGIKNDRRVDLGNLNVHNKSNMKDFKQSGTNAMMENTTIKESKTRKLTMFNYFGVHDLVINKSNDGFEPFCATESNRQKYLLWSDTPTDFTDWSFKKRRKCPKFVINDRIANTPRIKFGLNCDSGRAQLLPSKSTSSNDVDVVKLNSTCLYKFINACCSYDKGVPNVVHYVWYFEKAMKFETFLSILSVVRFVRPCLILFHGQYVPYGNYWDYIIRLFPYVIHVNTPRPLTISGKKIHHHEHSGDVMRIHALTLFGGIYLDTDVIVLRDLKPLRHYDITMCRQTGGQFLLNSFIMAKKNSTFLKLWLNGYDNDYRNESYVYNSMYYNNDLARKYPNLIHVENGTMCCPDELIGVNLQSPMIYEWTRLYGFHIYSRQINFPWNVDLIRNFSTTLGSMLRHVVYGNKELCL